MQFKKKEIKEIIKYTPEELKKKFISEMEPKINVGLFCNKYGVVDHVYVILHKDRLHKVAVRYGAIV